MKITWSLASPDDPGFQTKGAQIWKTTTIGDLDLANDEAGIDVARELAERYFTNDRWAQHIGDDTSETCFIEIHMPAEIKGRFEIDLERRIHAAARKMPA